MEAQAETRRKLTLLIEDFQTLYRTGELKGKAEATARTWVERLLSVFGWDPSDPRQVRQEYSIQGRAARRLRTEGTSHRRPDYCLLTHGRRTLYIDVKKVDANIRDDAGIAYQVRCYGWSEGFTLSYACDFEELAVYDCRIRPRGDDEADVARVLYLRHTDYLDHFDMLWDLCSREAVESGSIEGRFPAHERPKGSKTLDEDFQEKLSAWRKEIARSIVRYGKTRDVALLSAAAQRILDRIVFLRICEEIGLEELGSLLEMGQHEDGFWDLFLQEHEKRYATVYDGILFPSSGDDDPSGVDAHLRSWWLKGRIFREIVQSLYSPNPYRFDVIPIELLGGVYEQYLGKRLRVVGNTVEDEYKPEYQRTKGAVYTPAWVVQRVVQKTLDPLARGKDPEGILHLRVLDLSCGSASFLLGVYDYLETCVLSWFAEHPGDGRRADYVADTADGPRLSTSASRHLVDGCIFGVDIDAEAVEVARMSLCLRFLERTAAIDGEPHLLLKGIGRNIRQGNSLVGTDAMGIGIDADTIVRETMPFDWRNPNTGFGAVLADGGFDAVVGNPPYIEVKRYREWMPSQYRYLKESGAYETTAQGKTDISIPFMEKGVKLLREGGRLGYIIQNRFFKTDYGSFARAWLRRERAIAEIEDFRDLQVFSDRTTYTAILILEKGSPRIRYRTYGALAEAVAERPIVEYDLEWDAVDDGVWTFDQPDLMEIHRDLVRRHATIGDRRDFSISVGLQTLYGKLYQFDPVEERARTVVGRNGEGEEVSLERAALRPLCRNRGFYPFRRNNTDAWVIFPYDVVDGKASEIGWRQFKERFPKTAGYLEDRKRKLMKAVEGEDGANRWHLYKYPKNLAIQTTPKVLFPMTIEDTVASVDLEGNVYQDNVNVNSISFPGSSAERLKSLASVFNSTLFSALARLKAGLNDSGWRKLNRQYVELVPFPSAVIDDPSTVESLASLADSISDLQEHAIDARSEGARAGLRATLDSLWHKLDDAVESAYGLTQAQKEVVSRFPRRIDRCDLLTRQTVTPEDTE